jgi:hypothetical protein
MHKVRDNGIIIVVQVGGVYIQCTCSPAAAVEALRKKERQDETQFIQEKLFTVNPWWE